MLVGLVIAIAIDGGSVFANGGEGKVLKYGGRIEIASDEYIDFSSEINPILFLVNSMHGRYKVVEIKIKNWSKKKLSLSKESDKVAFDSNRIEGILDLAKHDPTLWDSMKPELREVLAYPQSILPNNEKNVYVFIPIDRMSEGPPGLIRYSFDSLPGKDATIGVLNKAMKK